MLPPPDKETRRAIDSLRGDPDFEVFLAWINGSLSQQRKDNDQTLDVTMLRRGQGCALTLDSLIEHVEGGGSKDARHR